VWDRDTHSFQALSFNLGSGLNSDPEKVKKIGALLERRKPQVAVISELHMYHDRTQDDPSQYYQELGKHTSLLSTYGYNTIVHVPTP
jgi:hypothetical protein